MVQNNLFKGETGLVTGASRGIGKDIALSLAEHGCDIVFCYRRDHDGAKELCASIQNLGRKVVAVQADISQESGVEKLFGHVEDRFGRLDILVNNAGEATDGLLSSLKSEDLYSIVSSNLIGTMLCCREALKIMLPQRHGRIINISSVSAKHPNKGQTGYAAAKGGVEAFTRALAVEVAGKGILVNAVAPGVIETEMTKKLIEQQGERIMKRILAKKLGNPKDISLAILYLANPANHYVTGEVISVNGGLTLS